MKYYHYTDLVDKVELSLLTCRKVAYCTFLLNAPSRIHKVSGFVFTVSALDMHIVTYVVK
jgi:hypothetical protein